MTTTSRVGGHLKQRIARSRRLSHEDRREVILTALPGTMADLVERVGMTPRGIYRFIVPMRDDGSIKVTRIRDRNGKGHANYYERADKEG